MVVLIRVLRLDRDAPPNPIKSVTGQSGAAEDGRRGEQLPLFMIHHRTEPTIMMSCICVSGRDWRGNKRFIYQTTIKGEVQFIHRRLCGLTSLIEFSSSGRSMAASSLAI